MTVRIRRARREDEDRIMAFQLARYGPGSYHLSRPYWRWLFLDNPEQEHPDLLYWLAEEDGVVVGQMGAIPFWVQQGDRRHRALYLVDYQLLESCRGQGLGKRLLSDCMAAADVLLALGTTPISHHLFLKAGWTDLGAMPRYIKVLRPLAFLRAAGAARPAAEAPERWSEELDELWSDCRPPDLLACPRTARWLNWRLLAHPLLRYEPVALRRAGRLCGVGHLRLDDHRPGRPVALLVDACARLDQPGDWRLLAQQAAARAYELGAVALGLDLAVGLRPSFWLTQGCLPLPSHIRLCVFTSNRVGPQEALRRRARWWLSRLDSDLDKPLALPGGGP